MATAYRLDIRYIPEAGVNSLKRVDRLTKALAAGRFEVSDVSIFDDGMRVSALVSCDHAGRNELKLLAIVSESGSIGRFSCRYADETESAIHAAHTEPALA